MKNIQNVLDRDARCVFDAGLQGLFQKVNFKWFSMIVVQTANWLEVMKQ